MQHSHKVIWSEGLFVTPQHFQQQDRYLTEQSQLYNNANSCYHWGILKLEIDLGLLAESKISIKQCQVILPDGTLVSTPQSIQHQQLSLPQPKEISATTRSQIVYLALPLLNDKTSNVSDNHNNESMARYIKDDTELLDSSSDNPSSENVELGRLNCRLLLQSEDRSAYSCVAIAKISHIENGSQIVLEKTFIPPTLNSHSIEVLSAYIKEAYGLIHTQAQAVLGYIRDDEYGRNFLLLQLLRRYEAIADHFSKTPAISPERFYGLLVQIINELALFQDDKECELARYEYHDLQKTFPPLMILLRRYLSMSADKDVFRVPLDNTAVGLYVTPMVDELKKNEINLRDLLGHASFYLAVKSKVGSDAVKDGFSNQVKIGPSQKIRRMVSLLVPGVKLKHCPRVPPKLPYDETFVYFEFEQLGSDWEELKKANGIGIHADEPFQKVELMLWAIRNK